MGSAIPSKAEALGGVLKAQPHGKTMWVAVRGSSMRPVLWGGESLKVRRCSEASLRRGEIAVLLRGDGALVSHLVVGTAPLRTESFAGTPDPPCLEALARAVAVRRGFVVVPLPRVGRVALLGLQRAWRLALGSERMRAAYAAVGAAAARLVAPPASAARKGPGSRR